MYQGKYLSNAKPQKAPKKAAPAPQEPRAPKEKKQKRKKRITVGTVIFYFLYFACIIAAAVAIRQVYIYLEDWLIRFEASQPDAKSQEIFQEMFADPDWGELYTLCGLEGTEFEGKEAYEEYMEAKVGDQELTYSMTSAGLSGGQKYLIRLGDEKVGSFIIKNHAKDELDIPDWKLESVEIEEYPRVRHVTVSTQPGRTVSVNGIPLDESYIVKTTSSAVENYLPEGVHGPSTATLYADGFLVEPEVLVIDDQGNLVDMSYDPETCTYSEAVQSQTFSEIPEAEKTALVEATKAYGRYIIGITSVKLNKYVDSTTEIYKLIKGNDQFFKGYTSYGFTEPVISEYCRYTDNFFSAKIQFTLNTYRPDGSVKAFEIDSTIFMSYTEKNGWLITNISNTDVHKITTLVRMTWLQDGQILETNMVDASENLLTPPPVTVPQGKEFVGWFKESMDENGDTTLSLVFAPTESGTISLPSDYILEPMVLQARFEAKGE